MRVDISSCLLVLILGFNVTAVMSGRGSFSMPRVRLPVFKPPPPVYVPRLPEINPRLPQFNYRPPVYNPRPQEFNFRPPVSIPRLPQYKPPPPVSNSRLPEINPRLPQFNYRPPVYNPRPQEFNFRPPVSIPRLPQYKPPPPAFNGWLPEIKPRPPVSNSRLLEFKLRLPEFNFRPPVYNSRSPEFNFRPPASIPRRPEFKPPPPVSNSRLPEIKPRPQVSNSRRPASKRHHLEIDPELLELIFGLPASSPNPPAPDPTTSSPNPPASNPNSPASTPRPPVFHHPRLADKQNIQRVLADPDRFLCYRESALQLPAIQPEECQKPFDQNMSIILSCPPSVEGNVMWSRETNGSKVDILTADGDKGKKHIQDLDGRYSLLANKSLLIVRAAVSDAGRYFCNREAAGELTVMNSVAPKHHKHHDLMDEVSTVDYGILFLGLFAIAFLVVLLLTVCYGYRKQRNKGKRHVQEEMQDGLECQPRNEYSA
ncbi:proline-rich extensin-like protein EPR1 isoform X1 [Sparus aurata]|uniref:proline-rich extensin-like protein EPR1 isoform X1 n=1 Tax=Sparus aurata TaxID=8175 RepID=UPI0011C12B2E|nr:proline-rich extensin-like protein EPR1 isoform X1 [Sparus aurata]